MPKPASAMADGWIAGTIAGGLRFGIVPTRRSRSDSERLARPYGPTDRWPHSSR